MTAQFRALTIAATVIGMDGSPKANPILRPLHVLNDGSGFAVVMKGSLVPVEPTGANTGRVSVKSKRLPKEAGRVARMADLGMQTKAERSAEPKSEPVKAKAAFTGDRIEAQRRVVRMLEAKLDKATSPKAKKAAEKGLATARMTLVNLEAKTRGSTKTSTPESGSVERVVSKLSKQQKVALFEALATQLA